MSSRSPATNVCVRPGIDVLECYAPHLFAQCHCLIVIMQHSSCLMLFLDTHSAIPQVRSAADLLLATGLHPVDQAVTINVERIFSVSLGALFNINFLTCIFRMCYEIFFILAYSVHLFLSYDSTKWPQMDVMAVLFCL